MISMLIGKKEMRKPGECKLDDSADEWNETDKGHEDGWYLVVRLGA